MHVHELCVCLRFVVMARVDGGEGKREERRFTQNPLWQGPRGEYSSVIFGTRDGTGALLADDSIDVQTVWACKHCKSEINKGRRREDLLSAA